MSLMNNRSVLLNNTPTAVPIGRIIGEAFYLDVGSSSGLFSLAARRLGLQVASFDFDSESVLRTLAYAWIYLSNDRYGADLNTDHHNQRILGRQTFL